MRNPILTLGFILISTFIFAQNRLNFDGYQDHVLLNGTDFAPPWTAEVLVQKNTVGAYSHLLTSTNGTSGFRLEQYINNNRVGITSAGIADWSFNYQLPVGEWVHLAFTCDGQSMKLYVNGIQTGGVINGTIPFPMGMIGLNTTGAGALNSKIDELRIWNTALPPTSISEYMLTEIPADHPQYDNLVNYYQFDDPDVTTALDSKGNLVGTIVGATKCPVVNRDMSATAMLSPAPFVGSFSTAHSVVFKISNTGLTPINEDFEVKYSLDGGAFESQIIEASSNPIEPLATRTVNFTSQNLTLANVHTFQLITDLPNDENTENDTLFAISSLQIATLQTVTDFEENNGEFIFSSNVSKVKVSFYRDDIFRIRVAPAGVFTDPTNGEILVIEDEPLTTPTATDEGNHYRLTTDQIAVLVYKSPIRFALEDAQTGTVIWQEAGPITFGQESIQRMNAASDEYFYGCGMQNGYFSHKNKSIKIENIYGNWADGDVPNPAPFFMSTAGYGVFRNTFARGQYDFFNNMTLTHRENNFDGFYFYGPSLKEILEGYTHVTGRPFMMPRWGMEFGDADCYNDTGTTSDVINQIAQKYRDFDLPGGWILPNDGYSCGYEDLEFVVDELWDLGFYTGLWTEDGVGNIAWEVGTAGTRLVKLDVALVGPGYQSAFNTGLSAFNGIEQNSNDRGYVWTVAGWAGTQRFATLWSGDQAGNWENIRFHIPTVIGAGLSGFNAATGDIDGIFGGSARTYVRDLQWKCFTPAMMTISGWAPQGKQPWAFNEPYTSYNRDYLKLKMRLTPYLYTCSKIAHDTGVPTARAMVLEFPDDPVTYDQTTQYQFMSGESFLVAPVYENTNTRDGIYLPEGRWFDWWDGYWYDGPMTLNGYDAPLEKLPLFVKGGSIIPMYPEMLYDNEKPKSPITFDVYPPGNSSFTLYEDDGHSREYRNGAFAETQIEASFPDDILAETVVINVGATVGDYEGKLTERVNIFQVHTYYKPTEVKFNGDFMTEYNSKSEWENATAGWYWDIIEKNGVTFVKTENISVDEAFEIRFEDFIISTEEADSEFGISVFPNPAEKVISIESKSEFPIEKVTVFDLTGRALGIFEKDFGEIHLPEIRGSILILEIDMKGGDKVFERVVIE